MNRDGLWVVVPNWDKFQHYKDRNPSWIKLYTELASRDEWLRLRDAERGLLVRIWIEYARSNGHLKVRSSGQTRSRLNTIRTPNRRLESLNHAGFIHFSASKPLAQRREEKSRGSVLARKTQNDLAHVTADEMFGVDEQMLALARDWLNPHDPEVPQ